LSVLIRFFNQIYFLCLGRRATFEVTTGLLPICATISGSGGELGFDGAQPAGLTPESLRGEIRKCSDFGFVEFGFSGPLGSEEGIMSNWRPLCFVLCIGMLASGSYMLYDALTNPLPGQVVSLLGGAMFFSLGAFAGYFCWRRTDYERQLAEVSSGAGGPRHFWRLFGAARRVRE
jgi:hypothetical protein